MPLKFEFIETEDFDKFIDKHNLTVLVKERDKKFRIHGFRFSATIENVEIKNGCTLKSACGNADTTLGAINKLIEELSEELIVINAMSPDRREIKCPRFNQI